MMDEEDLDLVPRTIKDYVKIAGGKVSLEALLCDFQEAYKTSIPFKEFGYPDLLSFLRSLEAIRVEKHEDDYYLISNSRKKTHLTATNNELYDVSNISDQLSNNLVIGDKIGKRKITVKSSSGSTNLNARKSIMNKMSLYSSSSSEIAISEVNEIHNDYVFSQNYTEPAFQAYIDYLNFSNLYGDGVLEDDQATFNSENQHFNYYTPQPIPPNTSSSSALPSYAQNPYYLMLIDFVNKHSLEFPVFETLPNVSSDNKSIFFNTILKIGGDNFISAPFYDLTESSIYENLLKTAYESLKNKHEYTFINTPQNAISNILEIINSYKNGVNTDFIEATYVQKYKISPPVNWFDLIESTSSVYIEPLSTQIMLYPYRAFLTATPFSTSLPNQIIPATDTWNIFITCCINTSAIWFRILDSDYDIRYNVLLTEMNKHYIYSAVSDAHAVNIGELYACFFDQNWYRAEVLSVRDNIAECRLVDTGMKKEFCFRSLFPLNHKFTNTPPLAFRCSMTGLKMYEKMNYISCQLKKILDNEVAVGKLNSEIDYELSMEIYLKNETFNKSVNKFFLNKIKNELNVPNIAKVGEFFDINLLSLDESGVARVQIKSESLILLKRALLCASKLIEQDGSKRSFYASPLLKLDLHQIYLAQIDTSWSRIMIKTLLGGPLANVECIDTGVHKIIDTKSIVLIDSLPDSLIHISRQCQTVRVLVEDRITQKLVNFMNRIFTQTNSSIVASTVEVMKIEDIPVVKLYKKQSDDETVLLKNIFFANGEQVTSINFVSSLCNVLPDNYFELFSNVSSSKVIPKYAMKKGDILNVVILKAVSPSNFVLKIENHPKFDEFMLELNNYHSLFSPPPVSKINIGKCYAVQLENNIYYRGLALHVIEDLKVLTVVVRLVDFAESVAVPLTAVYHTLPEFFSLPVQTLNAKLLNVKPLRGEWNQQDCYRFKELVYQKILNCVMVDFDDTLCKVVLLYGSNPKNMINVTSVLVNERRAILEEV